MYIPTSFFSSQGACITASVSTIAGNGAITTGSFVSGGFYWKYYQFEMSSTQNSALTPFTASLNILSGSTSQAKILIVGGGGTSATVGGINDGSIRTWTVSQAGGGGAGGVVYYNNFPLSSGSYEIGVASATSGNQLCSNTNTGALCGKVGKSSYIKLPNNSIYTPFNNSYLTAYGGGGGSPQGGFYLVSPFRPFYKNFYIDGAVFASAGGASGLDLANSPGNNSNTGAGGSGLGGLNGANQGQNGGAWQGGDPGQGYTDGGGPGGGGAAAAGANLGSGTGNFAKVTNGGNGLTYNLTGTTITVSNGGGGYNSVYPPATGQRGSSNADTFGSGGNGNGGTGNGGLVIIAWPVCSAAFDCKSFAIQGSGNTISYAECSIGSFFTSSVTLGLYDELDVCLTTLSGSNTPVFLSGGYSSLTLSGSCTGGSILRQKNAYQLLSCRSTHSLYVTLDNFDSYNTGSVLQTTTAALTTTSSCWTITDIIFPVITPVSLTNVNITSSYSTCIDCINNIPNNTYTVNYLIVGGGGGGGSSTTRSGGGGGAGQLLSGSLVVTGSITSTSITIGSGGAINRNGSNSTAFSLSSIGGGAGGYLNVSASSGGNGGGGAGQTGYETGATGSSGFAGGLGQYIMGSATAGGGGGGASQSGRNATNLDSGAARGGSGSVWINGTFYAGGGGGGFDGYSGGPTPLGGPGGGGRGSYNTTLASTAGTTNRGGGGGGSSSTLAGAAGGSGVVVIAYLGTQKGFGGIVTTSGSYTYHTFNSDGTFIA